MENFQSKIMRICDSFGSHIIEVPDSKERYDHRLAQLEKDTADSMRTL